jgi:hypothetical protein
MSDLNFQSMRQWGTGDLIGSIDMNSIRNNILYLRDNSNEIIRKELNIGAQISQFTLDTLPANDYDEYHLSLILRGDVSAGGLNTIIRINNISTNVYGNIRVSITATVSSNRILDTSNMVNALIPGGTSTANLFTKVDLVFSLINTHQYKTVSGKSIWGNPSDFAGYLLYGSANISDPITRIDIIPSSGNWAAGSGYILRGLRY